MSSGVRTVVIGALFSVVLGAGVTAAQQTSATSESRNFEVIAVDGNTLVTREAAGTREYTVPESFRFTVDGKPISVHELKPGMKGTATFTTVTTVTPVTVTEVKEGTVMRASANSLIIRGPDGIKAFSEGEISKRNIKILRNGKPASFSDFREGDRLAATIVTEQPPKVMTEQEVTATIAAASIPSTPPPASPTSAAPTAAPGAAAPSAAAPNASASAASTPAASGSATSAPAASAPAASAQQAPASASEAASEGSGFLLWAVLVLAAVLVAVYFIRRRSSSAT